MDDRELGRVMDDRELGRALERGLPVQQINTQDTSCSAFLRSKYFVIGLTPSAGQFCGRHPSAPCGCHTGGPCAPPDSTCCRDFRESSEQRCSHPSVYLFSDHWKKTLKGRCGCRSVLSDSF